MSTSSSATSTELLLPQNFDTKEFFTNKKENLIVIGFTFLVSIFMWTISPGIGIQALSFSIIYAIAAVSLNYQVGVTGIVNFGAVGFFAIGAYSATLATLLGWNWFSSLVIAVLITLLFSYLIAKTTLKLREDYFAIIMITIGEILRFIFNNENWLVYPPSQRANYGGSNGLVPSNPIRNNLASINIFGLRIDVASYIYTFFDRIHQTLLNLGVPGTMQINIGLPNWYMFSYTANIADIFAVSSIDVQNIIFLLVMIITLIIGYIIFERVYNSPLGRLDKAIRDDDLSVEATGVNIFKNKVFAFDFANVLIAIAGAFFAFQLGTLAPEDFLPLITFYIWAIIVLGGLANNRGVILGGVIFGSTAPLVSNIQLRSQITALSGSLTHPILPGILSIFTDFLDPAIKTWKNTFSFNLTWFLNLLTNPVMNFNIAGVILPLSSLIFLIIVLVFLGIKIATMRESKQLESLTKNPTTKLVFNVVFVIVIGVFLANIIISPSQTFIINLTFTTLFLLTTVIVLILLIGFQVLLSRIPPRTEEEEATVQERRLRLSRKILVVLFLLNILPILTQDIAILPIIQFNQYNLATGVKFTPISYFFTNLDPNLARIMVVGFILMAFILFKPEGILREKRIKTVDSLQEYTSYYKSHIDEIETDLNIPKAEFPKGFEAKDNILSATNLTKSFGGVVGLDKVTVSVKQGSLLGVIGPNGSGKSTFFNVLTGLLDQDKDQEGKIEFLKKDITYFSISERAQLGMGRTFQQSRLFKNLTVLENVLVSAKEQRGTKLMTVLRGNWKKQESELHQQAFQILQYLNILHIWNNKASDISGGQQKLVSLARALMSQSHIILLDEPVAGVNPTLAKKIFEKIQNLHQKEGQHYIIIEHNMDVQLNFCDYVFVFNKGQIVAEGTPEEIRKNESVLDAYLGH